MEITFFHHRTPFTPSPVVQISNIISTHKNYVNPTTFSPSNSSIQIQLPLHRPQPRYHRPIEQSSKKINGDDNFRTSSTPSDILRLMDSLKLPVTVDLYVSLIKECTKLGDPLEATELHDQVKNSGIRPDLHFINLLLLMNVCCNCMPTARELFDKMSVRNAYSWAVMIGGYFENGEYRLVIDLFLEMLSWDGAKSDEFDDDLISTAVSGIIVCVLKACVKTMNLELGKQVHGLIIRAGYSTSTVLSSSLMRFYGEFGFPESSENVFSHVPCENMVVWTARIVNCCKEKRFDKAVDVFREMGQEGVKRNNSFTISNVLKACGKMRNNGGFLGRQVHASAIKSGVELDEYVQCSLVDMYGKCGLVNDAKSVFSKMLCAHKKNKNSSNNIAACWNALVSGYIQQGLCIESIQILYEMKAAGLEPHESLLRELRSLCDSYMTEK